LVAAAERGDQHLRPGSLDSHVLDLGVDILLLASSRDQGSLHSRQQTGQRKICPHAHELDKAIPLTILGNKTDSKSDPLRYGAALEVGVTKACLPCSDRLTACECLHQLGASRTHEAVETHDLAFADGQRDVVNGEAAAALGVDHLDVLK